MIDTAMGLVTALSFVVFLVEPLPVDPMMYLNAGVDPMAAEPNHWATRLGIVIPVWLASLVFGYSEMTYYAFPILIGFIFGFATSALGRYVTGRAIGSVAALVAFVGPMVLPFGTQLLPDVGATAFLTLAGVMLLRASRVEGRAQTISLIASGAAFGCAYLIRETVLIFGPSLLLCGLLLRLRVRHIMGVAAGALVAPGLEAVAAALVWSDPLARIHGIINNAEGSFTQANAARHLAVARVQDGVWASFTIFVDHMWDWWYGRIVLLGAAGFGVVAVLKRNRVMLFPFVWALPAWVLLALMGAYRPEPNRVIINLNLDRYWAELIPSAAVALVGLLVAAYSWASKRSFRNTAWAFGLIVVSMVLVLGIAASFERRGAWFMRFGHDDYWQLRKAMSLATESSDVLVPARLENLVELYAHDPYGSRSTPLHLTSSVGRDVIAPWLLFHGDATGAKPQGDAAILATPPPHYSVLAAERSGPRWVLLAPEPHRDAKARLIAKIAPGSETAWLARIVSEGEWGEAFLLPNEAIVLGDGQQLIISDGSAPMGAAPGMPTETAGGSLVELRTRIHLDAGGIRQACQLFPGGDAPRFSIHATSMITAGPVDEEIVGYCSLPEAASYAIRPVLVIDGPGTVSIGSTVMVDHGLENR